MALLLRFVPCHCRASFAHTKLNQYLMSDNDSVSAASHQRLLSASDAALTVVDHASPNSSSTIAQEVVPHFAISPVTQYEIIIVEITIAVSHARTQDITSSTTAWSATVPTSFAGVVAVFELCAFPVVISITHPRRASRPTNISDIALPMAPAATLPQCGCRDGRRQQ